VRKPYTPPEAEVTELTDVEAELAELCELNPQLRGERGGWHKAERELCDALHLYNGNF
jgi:hypothetical protein